MKKIGELFASRNQLRLLSSITGELHGRPWLTDELDNLKRWFLEGNTIEELITKSERSASGVIPKLKAAGLISDQCVNTRTWGYDYYYAVDIPCIEHPKQPKQPEPIEPKTIMAEANIKTLILIQGVDAAQKSDDDIFKLIAKLEQEAASLNNISNKPKKLLAKIKEIEADIDKLVEFVDAR